MNYFLKLCVLAWIAVLLSSSGAAAQMPNHGSVLLAGSANQNFRSPAGQNVNTLFNLKSISPGIEYRTNPRGRVSWGIGLEQLKLKRQQSGTWINAQTASQQRIAWTDRYVSGTINAVTATAYINILTQRMIQPFIGIGGGAGLGKIEYENHTAVDPAFLNDPVMGNLLRSLQGQVTTNRQKTYDAVLKGVVGVSFFPNPHLVISGSGGYKNGAAGLFQFGVVF